MYRVIKYVHCWSEQNILVSVRILARQSWTKSRFKKKKKPDFIDLYQILLVLHLVLEVSN